MIGVGQQKRPPALAGGAAGGGARRQAEPARCACANSRHGAAASCPSRQPQQAGRHLPRFDGLVEEAQDGGPALIFIDAGTGAVRHCDDAKPAEVADAALVAAALQGQPWRRLLLLRLLLRVLCAHACMQVWSV